MPKTGSGASFGQTGGRQRTFSTGSRVSYVSYSARRPSLSLSHSDAIPYYMEKPTKEEGINVDEGKSDLQKRTYEFMSFSAVYVFLSQQSDGMVIFKGCVQLNPVYG